MCINTGPISLGQGPFGLGRSFTYVYYATRAQKCTVNRLGVNLFKLKMINTISHSTC